MNKQELDGYYLGVVYNVVMNRAAAEEWMSMPQGDDVRNLWTANGAAYRTDWTKWIKCRQRGLRYLLRIRVRICGYGT